MAIRSLLTSIPSHIAVGMTETDTFITFLNQNGSLFSIVIDRSLDPSLMKRLFQQRFIIKITHRDVLPIEPMYPSVDIASITGNEKTSLDHLSLLYLNDTIPPLAVAFGHVIYRIYAKINHRVMLSSFIAPPSDLNEAQLEATNNIFSTYINDLASVLTGTREHPGPLLNNLKELDTDWFSNVNFFRIARDLVNTIDLSPAVQNMIVKNSLEIMMKNGWLEKYGTRFKRNF